MKKPLIVTTLAFGALLAGAAYAQQTPPAGTPPGVEAQQRDGATDRGDEPRRRSREDRGDRGDGRWSRGDGPGFRGDMMRERMAAMCSRGAERFGERMLDRIERVTRPTTEQRPAFDRLKEASTKAAEIMKGACPAEPSFTPPGRLANAEKQLAARLEAVRTVRPAMDAFYGSLTDEQKARLSMSRPMGPRGPMMGPMRERHGDWRGSERGWRQGWHDDDRGGFRGDRNRGDRFGGRDSDDGDDRGSRRGFERTDDSTDEL